MLFVGLFESSFPSTPLKVSIAVTNDLATAEFSGQRSGLISRDPQQLLIQLIAPLPPLPLGYCSLSSQPFLLSLLQFLDLAGSRANPQTSFSLSPLIPQVI